MRTYTHIHNKTARVPRLLLKPGFNPWEVSVPEVPDVFVFITDARKKNGGFLTVGRGQDLLGIHDTHIPL